MSQSARHNKMHCKISQLLASYFVVTSYFSRYFIYVLGLLGSTHSKTSQKKAKKYKNIDSYWKFHNYYLHYGCYPTRSKF